MRGLLRRLSVRGRREAIRRRCSGSSPAPTAYRRAEPVPVRITTLPPQRERRPSRLR